jgi:tetratricopeptide (TPR) repeat protein
MSGRRDQHDAKSSKRTEPTLGDLDNLDAPRAPRDAMGERSPQVVVEPPRPAQRHEAPARKRPPPPRKRARRRWMIPVLLLLLVAVAAGLWFNQGRLRSMLPRTDFNSVLVRAQQALQDGRLNGQDGTSARELFQAAVALEPDNDQAREGLHQVGQAELSQADASLQAGQLVLAAQQAAVARELLGGGADIDRLDQLISTARAARVKTVDLVDQAKQAMDAGKLKEAGALYQQVLRADPNNAVASHGLDQVGYALAVQAHRALAAQDDATAAASIELLASLQPNNGELPALRALQAQNRKQESQSLDTALTQGQDALRAGHISGEGDDTALAYFQAALKLDPGNAQALAGLGRVAQAITVRASAAMDAGDPAQAKRLLDQAATLAPKSADLAAARARLASMPQPGGASSSDVAMLTPAGLSPEQSLAIKRLVARARTAARNGNIMMPPGDCAYDLYRSALAMNGNDQAALNGLHGLPDLVQQQFNQALAAGQLSQASARLADLAQLSPGDAAQGALSSRLASAWLDQAEQQLASGDRVGARQALEQARKLAPNHPRVVDLTARLQSGQ